MKSAGFFAILATLIPLAARGQSPPAGAPAALLAPAAHAMLETRGRDSERQLISLVMRRTEVSGDARRRLELQIDLRIIQRWLASAQQTDDAAVIAVIRLGHLRDVMPLITDHLTSAKSPLGVLQKEAATRLHQLTFTLPADPSAGQLDSACRNVGQALMQIATDKPIDPAKFPPMRPSRLPGIDMDDPRAGDNSTTRADSATIIAQLTVGGELRKQLLHTMDMIQRPAWFDLSDDDARQLQDVLRESLDISAGLASNAGVGADKRADMEQRLSESLALFGDKRLRDLAAQRIKTLSRYRQVLATITRLNLPKGTYLPLSPAFVYAQENPASPAQVLGAVEKFAEFSAAYDATPEVLPESHPLAKLVAIAYAQSRKSFEQARGIFLYDISKLSANVGDLAGRLDEMEITVDAVSAIAAAPRIVETFAAFKPRPTGGLERRFVKEATIVASNASISIRKEAARTLAGLVRLDTLARDLDSIQIEPESRKVLEKYSGKTPEDLLAKCRANIGDLINQAAAASPLDRDKLERTASLRTLVSALASAAAIENRLPQANDLARFADWGMDREELDRTLAPSRNAVKQAVAGLLNDQTQPLRALSRVRREQGPILRFVLRNMAGASQIPAMPTALETQCAKLMTPLTSAEFCATRYVSVGLIILNSQLGADDLRKELNQRISQQP